MFNRLKLDENKLRDMITGVRDVAKLENPVNKILWSRDIAEGIKHSSDVLNIVGKVLPVTLDEIKICAELADGTTIERKSKILQVVSERIEAINRVYISPSNCKPAPGVLEAISEAEAIIIGPGSLYTNVLPNLLVKRVSKAIKESKAIKMYISKIMTELFDFSPLPAKRKRSCLCSKNCS